MHSCSVNVKLTIFFKFPLCRSGCNADIGTVPSEVCVRLMPNHGVVFKGMTKMQTMRDVYLLHLHVRLPDLVKQIQTLSFQLAEHTREAHCSGRRLPLGHPLTRFPEDGNDALLGAASEKVCEHLARVTTLQSKKVDILRNETLSKVNEMGMFILAFESESPSRGHF